MKFLSYQSKYDFCVKIIDEEESIMNMLNDTWKNQPKMPTLLSGDVDFVRPSIKQDIVYLNYGIAFVVTEEQADYHACHRFPIFKYKLYLIRCGNRKRQMLYERFKYESSDSSTISIENVEIKKGRVLIKTCEGEEFVNYRKP